MMVNVRSSICSIVFGILLSATLTQCVTSNIDCTPRLVLKANVPDNNYLLTFSTDLANEYEAKQNCTGLGGELAQITSNDLTGNTEVLNALNAMHRTGQSSFRIASGTKAVNKSDTWISMNVTVEEKHYYVCKVNANTGVLVANCQESTGVTINWNTKLQELLRKDSQYNWVFNVTSSRKNWESRENADSLQIVGLQPSTLYKFQITTILSGCQEMELKRTNQVMTGSAITKPVTDASVADSETCSVKIPTQKYHPEFIKKYLITASSNGTVRKYMINVNAAAPQFIKIPTIDFGLSRTIGLEIEPISKHCKTASRRISGRCFSPACLKTIVADEDKVFTLSYKTANVKNAEEQCDVLGGHLAFSTILQNNNTLSSQLRKKYWLGDMIYMRDPKNDSFIKKVSIVKSAAEPFHLSLATFTCKRDSKCAKTEHHYVCQTKPMSDIKYFMSSWSERPIVFLSLTTDTCNSTAFNLQWSSNLALLTNYTGHSIQFKVEVSDGEDNNIANKTFSYLHNNVTITDLQPRSTYFAKVIATFEGCSTFNVTAGINATTGSGIPDPIESAYVNDTAEGCIITIPNLHEHTNVTYYVNTSSNVANNRYVFHQTNETKEISPSFKFPVSFNAQNGAKVVEFEIQVSTCEGESPTRQVEGVCDPTGFEETTTTPEGDGKTQSSNSTPFLASAIASSVVVVGIAVIVTAYLCKRIHMRLRQVNAAPDGANPTVQYSSTYGDVINLTDTKPGNGDHETHMSAESQQVVNVLYGEVQEVREPVYAATMQQNPPHPSSTATSFTAPVQQNEMHDVLEETLYAFPVKKQMIENVLYGSV